MTAVESLFTEGFYIGFKISTSKGAVNQCVPNANERK